MRLMVLLVAAIAVSCEGVSLAPFPLTRVTSTDSPKSSGAVSARSSRIAPTARQKIGFTSPCCRPCGGSSSRPAGISSLVDRDKARVAWRRWRRFFRAIRRHRDIVLVDLRGTGASHPLACDNGGDDVDALSETDVADRSASDAPAASTPILRLLYASGIARRPRRRAPGARLRPINLWGGSWERARRCSTRCGIPKRPARSPSTEPSR